MGVCICMCYHLFKWSLTSACIRLMVDGRDISHKLWHVGRLPEEWGSQEGMQALTELYLDGNNFSGPVPDYKSSCRSAHISSNVPQHSIAMCILSEPGQWRLQVCSPSVKLCALAVPGITMSNNP